MSELNPWVVFLTLAIAALAVAARISQKPSKRMERYADRVFNLPRAMDVPPGIFEPPQTYHLTSVPVMCERFGCSNVGTVLTMDWDETVGHVCKRGCKGTVAA